MLKVYRALSEDINLVFDFCRNNNVVINKDAPSVFVMKNDEDIIGICEYIMNDFLDAAFFKELYIVNEYKSKNLEEFLVKSVLNYLEMIKIYNVYVSFDTEYYKDFYEFLRFNAVQTMDASFGENNKKYIYNVNLKGYFDVPCSSCSNN